MATREFIDSKLRDVALFAACSKRELRQMSKLMSARSVRSGTVLAIQGEVGSDFVVVVAGTARVDRDDKTLAELGPGQWFGEIALLDERHLRTASVTATSDMEIEVMDGASFEKLLERHPRIARKILAGLARLVAEPA